MPAEKKGPVGQLIAALTFAALVAAALLWTRQEGINALSKHSSTGEHPAVRTYYETVNRADARFEELLRRLDRMESKLDTALGLKP